MFKKIKIYFFSSLTLSSLVILMYMACILFAFDAPIAYFSNASPLPYIAKYLLIFSTIVVVSMLFFIPKGTLYESTPQYSKSSRVSSAIVAVSLIAYSLMRFIMASNGYIQPSKLFFACIGLAIVSAVFYLMTATTPVTTNSTRAILLLPTILWATTSMTEAYLNQYVTMNSPIKIFLMLSMMSIMFFALYEARFLINHPYPRAYAISVLIGVCLSAVFSTSFIIMQVSGKYSIPEFLPTAITSLTFAVYKLCRAFDFLRHQSLQTQANEVNPTETTPNDI